MCNTAVSRRLSTGRSKKRASRGTLPKSGGFGYHRRMRVADFDFDLPAELIAQHPPPRRSDSRLLCLDPRLPQPVDRQFIQLPDLLDAQDVLVFNNTKVIKARLFGVKDSGGKIEVLVERILSDCRVLAHLRASHAPKPGSTLYFADGRLTATVIERHNGLYVLALDHPDGALAALDQYGAIPLPPYIEREPDAADADRYQTVYARHPGAVAAPTAGLHFDDAMLERLAAQGNRIAYVTLHVGAGTFQPVRADRLADHHMHFERYEIPAATVQAIEMARRHGGRVVAVGTTSLRALEAAAQTGRLEAGCGDTDLFITPGYPFRVVDRLITNFHLPKSTLLMLVSAFAGHAAVMAAYRHAVAERYRFFSYGDAMLIDRKVD